MGESLNLFSAVFFRCAVFLKRAFSLCQECLLACQRYMFYGARDGRWGAEMSSLACVRAGGRVTNAKIQNGRAFCKKKREFLPTLLRSENFAPKVAKPFVSGHFSKGRKGSEIGRKIFEIWVLGDGCSFSRLAW